MAATVLATLDGRPAGVLRRSVVRVPLAADRGGSRDEDFRRLRDAARAHGYEVLRSGNGFANVPEPAMKHLRIAVGRSAW